MKKAVIFDLDGTLSDSIRSMKYCGDLAVAPLGMGPFSEQQYQYFVGDGAANLVRRALACGGDKKGVHFEETFARYKELFAQYCMYEVKPYDGIETLLEELSQRDVAVCVFSNKPHVETLKVIISLFGDSIFDVIRGQQEGVPIKPDPEGVRRILEQLRVNAEDCLYLGDTATDMKTGKNAGLFTIGALWGFRTKEELAEAGADALIAHPMELLAYL